MVARERRATKVATRLSPRETASSESDTGVQRTETKRTDERTTGRRRWWPFVLAVLLAAVALLVGVQLQLAAHNRSLAVSAHTQTLDRVLTSLDTSLGRYVFALHPLAIESDRRLLATEMSLMRADLRRLNSTLAALESIGGSLESILSPDQVHRTHSLPMRVLDAIVSHRSRVIKEVLAGELQGRLFATAAMVDEFDRQAGAFMTTPLEAIITYHGRFRWTTVVPGQRWSAVEFAVERGLQTAVRLMLPHAQHECQPTLHAASPSRLSALQLAENNGDDSMSQLLRDDANPCLVTSTLDARRSRHRAAIRARPIQIDEFNLLPTDVSDTDAASRAHRAFGDGGWRKSARNGILDVTSSLPSNGCPFVRIPLQQLTVDLFRAHHDNKQPMILTHALDAEKWSIARRLTREAIARDWADINVSAGAIPYAQHFAMRNGLVTFEEFLAYMDDTYESQRSTAVLTPPPFYIFDFSMFEAMNWNLKSGEEEATAQQTKTPETSASQTKSIERNFYSLPSEMLSVLNTTASAPQFYLGSEGSGAPFHFHCPALNLLAYGEKLWWLHPPALGLYSKQTPLASLLDSSASSLPHAFTCLQQPGELLFVPSSWSHATINTRESVGVAVEIDVGGC